MFTEEEAKQRHREAVRRYKEANREKIAEKKRQYNEAHREEIAENNQRWREANPERKRELDRRWREANRERTTETNRRWYKAHAEERRRYYQAHREEAREAERRWREANRAKRVEASRRYNKANPVKVNAIKNRRRARIAGGSGSYTEAEWQALCEFYDNRCLSCGLKVEDTPEGKLSPDHVIPIAKGGSNDISNIQPLCLSCNLKKHTTIIDYRTKPFEPKYKQLTFL